MSTIGELVCPTSLCEQGKSAHGGHMCHDRMSCRAWSALPVQRQLRPFHLYKATYGVFSLSVSVKSLSDAFWVATCVAVIVEAHQSALSHHAPI